MSQVGMYFDGFNLYHAIDVLKRPELKWTNLQALAESYLRPGDGLAAVKYFTAVVTWDIGKAHRHRAYLRALEAVGVSVYESSFAKVHKFCSTEERYCKFKEEKQTDVSFAVEVLADIHAGRIDRAILATADSDQIPLVRHVTAAYPHVSVEIAAPPDRMQFARELCATASEYGEITPGRLRTCLLPRDVTNALGAVVARCPSDYLRAEDSIGEDG